MVTFSGVAIAFISLILGIAVLISVWRKDKTTVVTPRASSRNSRT